MYFYLINNKRPIKSKYPIVDMQELQGKIKNMIVTNVKSISMFSYLYHSIKYEIYGG